MLTNMQTHTYKRTLLKTIPSSLRYRCTGGKNESDDVPPIHDIANPLVFHQPKKMNKSISLGVIRTRLRICSCATGYF